MTMHKDERRRLRRLEITNSDLHALVDTLQTALRRADVALKDHEEYDYVFAQSARWALNEKI